MNSKLLFLLILVVVAGNRSLLAQSTAFTYQGRLDSSGALSTGGYDLRVAVFDAADGGSLRGLLTNSAVAVSNGLFTTTLDFGFGVFNGGPRWLEFGVRSNGTTVAFSTLAPRQAILPAPYAFWSANANQAVTVTGTVPSSGLNGLYSNPVNFSNPGNSLIGGFAGDGTGLNNVNAAQLGGRSAAQFWQTGGNAGADPTNGAFLGTTDNQPVEIKANNARILRLEPHATSPNVIGGHPVNNVNNGVAGAFIGGGGNTSFPNRVDGDYATVPGGLGNIASGYASLAMGGGSYAAGSYSTAMGDRAAATGPYSTALGIETWAMGSRSTALGVATTASGVNSTALGSSTAASGRFSTALGNTTTASGENSTALGKFTTASGESSTGLGESTRAVGNFSTAMGAFTAAGGESSTAMGRSTVTDGFAATAMGYRARALHDGSFVWADFQNADFDSTSANQFNLRASGGVRLNNDTSLSFGNQTRQMINLWGTNYGIGVQSDTTYFRTGGEFFWYRGGSHSDAFADAGGGDQLMRLGSTGDLIIAGTLSQGSDRHIKQDFTAVNPQEVLDKVAVLAIQTWTYTNDVSRRHLGPVAQDFHTAFGLNGTDDKHIATVDANGVALAAIQGLNLKLEEKEARIQTMERELAALKEIVTRLSNQRE